MRASRFFTKARLDGLLDRLFGIDVRSLALVRVSLGFLVLANLGIRASSLAAHYGGASAMPPSVAAAYWDPQWFWSLHLLGGGPLPLVACVFAIHAVAALALILGYRTRLATIVVWLLTVSLHNANPLVISGDVILRSLLFVGMFLPWASVYSVDSILRRTKDAPSTIRSAWSAAYLLQLGFLYFFAVLFKTGAEWHEKGSAVYYALSLDQFVTPIGKLLLAFPDLTTLLTHAVVVLQYAAFALLFFPVYTAWIRLLGLAALVAMHVGLGVALHLGDFSWLLIAALAGFLPSEAWSWVERRASKRFGNVAIYYDGDCGFCRSSARLLHAFLLLPESIVGPAQVNTRVLEKMRESDSWVVVTRDGVMHVEFDAFIGMAQASPLLCWLAPLLRVNAISRVGLRVYRFVAQHRSRTCTPDVLPEASIRSPVLGVLSAVLGIFYIMYIFFWQASMSPAFMQYVQFPQGWVVAAKILRIDQRWNIFSPYPLKEDGWYVIPGELADGTMVDLFRNGSPVSYEKPANVASLYRNERWRKYMMNLWSTDNASYRPYYAEWLCRDWDQKNSESKKLVSLELVYMLEETPPPGELQQPVVPVTLLSWRCAR